MSFETEQRIGRVVTDYAAFLEGNKWYAHAGENDTGELAYHALGLAGEGGEYVDLVKKVVRDWGYAWPLTDASNELLAKLRSELGDLLWYLTQSATLLGLTIPELMRLNMDKLEAREAKGERQHVR